MDLTAVQPQTNYYFLQNGGELGSLTRAYDWASTPLGSPGKWSQSLRVSVSTVLNSGFPMLLFWGEEMTCFYNDAFRPSLGAEGRHPSVGKNARDMWADTWETIGPLLERVKATGEPVYFENLLVPYYRDGKIDDTYWTFSYSPVYGESGTVEGIMVVCKETTEEVVANKKLIASDVRFKQFISEAAVGIVILNGHEMRIELANDAYGRIISKDVADITGKKIFDVVPETEPYFREKIEQVMINGEPVYLYDHPYFVIIDGKKQEGFLDLVYQPYRDEGKDITGVMILCHDVSEKVLVKRQLEDSEQRLRSVIEAAPFPIGIMTGKEMRIAFANQSIKDAWGKGNDVEGMTFAEVLPELSGKGYYEALDSVYNTGEAFHSRNERIELVINGELQTFYYNYSYSPLFDTDGKVYGVMNTAANITDIAIARQKVEESEQNLRNMILQAPVAMCMLMGDTHKIEVANDLMIEIWGRPKEEVMGLPVFDALPSAREQGLETLMETVYKKGETFKANEMPVRLFRNGKYETVYQNFVYEPYRDTNGAIAGVLAVTVDVTQQVIARRKTEDSEQQVRSIIDSAPFPIGVYTGPEKTIAFANKSIMDVWGKGYDVVGKTYTEILPELENQLIFAQVTQVYETGIPFHARNQRVDLVVDNKLQSYWFNYSFTPLFDADGKVYGVMNTAAEVTDLNRAKQKIEESERDLRNIILQAPMATCIYRGDNYVIEVANNAMFEFWGVEGADVLGKPLFDALPEVRNQGFEDILNNVLKTGTRFVANEMTATLKRDGVPTDVFINFTLEPMREADGTISAILAVAIDVSPQVIARLKIEEIVAERTQELATTNQHLQRSNAELEQFAYIASHDLQEPLRKVKMFAEMLESALEGEVPEQTKRYLSKINSSTERMTKLIRDVLSYSQLSRDEHQSFQPVDLNILIDDIKTDYELLIAQKNAKIIFSDLPTLEASPQQLSQLFSNLLSNALKFAREGEQPEISITCESVTALDIGFFISQERNDKYYKIEVRDNGIGFDQEHADKIFNIFQRLHGKAEYSGTGIGLAMCKKIALNHRGNIYATSEYGKGASFTVLLPEKQIDDLPVLI